jgi:antitoxin YefM
MAERRKAAPRNDLAREPRQARAKVNDDHAPVLITRRRGKPAVLMSLEDFSSYVETDYLLSSPKNAARLGRAVRQLKSGKGKARKLIR